MKQEKAGKKIKVGKFPFIGNGKAIALGAGNGLVKTIFDETTGELLGAHMIGAEVTELIQGYVIARQAELTEQDLMHTIFPAPNAQRDDARKRPRGLWQGPAYIDNFIYSRKPIATPMCDPVRTGGSHVRSRRHH